MSVFDKIFRFTQQNQTEKPRIDELLMQFQQCRDKCLNELKALPIGEDDFQKEGIHPEFNRVTLNQL